MTDDDTRPTELPDFAELPPPKGGRFHGSVFVGRRRSDRWLTYLTMALMISMFVFVTYTSWQQTQSAKAREEAQDQRNEIIDTLRNQNENLLCFADTTQAFELAISNLLLVQQNNPQDPQTQVAIDELRKVQGALVEAKRLCFTPAAGDSPSTSIAPPQGTIQPSSTPTEQPPVPPGEGAASTSTDAPTEPTETTTAASPEPTESPPPPPVIEETTTTTEPPTTTTEPPTTTTAEETATTAP